MPRANLKSVFINVPFDKKYEPLFCALVATVVGIGGRPRCVLEEPTANVRLDRLIETIRLSRYSIHDMSRVERSSGVPRFNMAFELGLVVGHRWKKQHQSFVLEAEQHRLTRSLSDMNGLDPHIHRNSSGGVVESVLNALGTGRPDETRVLKRMSRALLRAMRKLERSGEPSMYTRIGFLRLVQLATALAVERGLLAR